MLLLITHEMFLDLALDSFSLMYSELFWLNALVMWYNQMQVPVSIVCQPGASRFSRPFLPILWLQLSANEDRKVTESLP